MPLRSHHGCARCKHRRQKCDEKQPSCTRCKEAAVTCEYVITLKWDGRVPRKQEQTSSRRRPRRRIASATSLTVSGIGHSPETRLLKDEGLKLMEVDIFHGLDSRDKLLLNHFITHVSQLMSHASVRDQACQILPVALGTPYLLYATLAFSALHLSTLQGGDSGGGRISDTLVTDILACSITYLRQELDTKNPTSENTPALLHTVKTLCLFEIYSGKHGSSWRAHLKGARALLITTTACRNTTNELHGGDWLIVRWYVSIEALSALTNDDTRNEEQQAIQLIIDSVATQGSVLDVYAGYAADLHLAFKDIGGLMQRFASMRENYCGDDILADLLRHCDECIEIEQRVENMIHRDRDGGLKIPAEISLTPEEFQMFSACNTEYQYSALLQIRRRLYNMPSGSEQTQQCVRGVLDAVCNVLPVTVLSPWILLTTPIFTAGCEAINQDRETVKQLLVELYTVLRIRNILRALEVLEKHWERPDDSYTDVADFLPF
ncbi:hypothetical protein TMatcc_002073 [Talaromyces marneffei ATCC 18224]|uniref:Zn(2)-C6 fungal-type domain-containing protein n=1 Tax=Talaromyces marneffei (strain ATCC 18224 / CBS 334.59 / QM 7333) TaxID=441960 RepID=B6QIM2_TALMQ|nr:conserved hypothetical protein [Talaromyces marneffei ATCC 18224]KAE8552065.1 hypothetical protein EYB25_005956 [Talaromyces marneffei]